MESCKKFFVHYCESDLENEVTDDLRKQNLSTFIKEEIEIQNIMNL